MTTEVLAADTGPDGGVRCLDVEQTHYYNYFHGSQPVSSNPIAGVQDWRKRHHKAFGLSQSLYDTDPETNKPVGEPNADAFAVVARENNAFLAVADGCGWGVKSFLAARTAVKGCIEYLSKQLHKASTTQEIMDIMLNSFKYAHECIVDSKGTVTTLCAAVICKIQGINCYGLCVVNVGDSLAFVYRKDGYVQEVTVGSHSPGERDMKQAGGCIGPLVGDDPDLGNLTCSFTFVDEGDIVFLTSDGISDNFDPQVLKITSPGDLDHLLTPVKPSKSQESLLDQGDKQEKATDARVVTQRRRSYSAPVGREIATTALAKNMSCTIMKEVIQSESPCGEESSAKELCAKLMNFVVQNTLKRRTFLEQNRNCKREEFDKKKKSIPGKLDHATVVAFEVGHFQPQPFKLTFHDKQRPQEKKKHSLNVDQNARKTTKSTSEHNFDYSGNMFSALKGVAPWRP
ncbi:PP2C-like domain-containing protein CG9801 isoform X2 [Dendronephthya gigantea]|nr:PP2C-like domain-containing protein CG9801 isoform X2 [Dendronephthya gigantea]